MAQGTCALDVEVLSLKPGDIAIMHVEIFEHPAGDLTNIRVSMRGYSVRFCVPTASLSVIRRP